MNKTIDFDSILIFIKERLRHELKGPEIRRSNSTSGAKNGINNTLNLTSSSAFSNGISNVITGNSDWKFGIRNFINTTFL